MELEKWRGSLPGEGEMMWSASGGRQWRRRAGADRLLGQLAGSMAGWTVCSVITPIEHVKGTYIFSRCLPLLTVLPQPSSKCRPSAQSSTADRSTVRNRSCAPTVSQDSGTASVPPSSSARGSAPCEPPPGLARTKAECEAAGSGPTRS